MARELDPERNPFYEHAEAQLFLAWRDGEVVGRIAAIGDAALGDSDLLRQVDNRIDLLQVGIAQSKSFLME